MKEIGVEVKIKGKKNGKLLTSHRYNHLPLLHSCPGGFNRSWSYKTCQCKSRGMHLIDKMNKKIKNYFTVNTFANCITDIKTLGIINERTSINKTYEKGLFANLHTANVHLCFCLL